MHRFGNHSQNTGVLLAPKPLMLSVQILRSSWVLKGLTYSVGRLFAGMGEAEEELSVAEWGQPPGLLQRPHSRPFACNSNELGFPPLLF